MTKRSITNLNSLQTFSNLISLRQIVAGQEEVKDICGSNPSYITRATSITGIRALLKNQNTLT